MRSTDAEAKEGPKSWPWQGAPTVPNGAAAVGNRGLLGKVRHRITI